MASALALFTLASLAMAQTTTINVPFLGYDDFNFAVSIVGADSTATTMSLACPTGTEESDCGVFPYHTLIYGPSTYKMDMSVPGDGFTMTQDCSMAASSAVCKESASGSEANFPGSSTETYEGSMAPSNAPVTVTAGAEKLTAGASAAPSTSATPTAAASSASGPAATNGTTLSTSGTPTGSGSAPESTGAASILSSGLPLALSALFAALLL